MNGSVHPPVKTQTDPGAASSRIPSMRLRSSFARTRKRQRIEDRMSPANLTSPATKPIVAVRNVSGG
jgi:hypothetical protein